MFSVSNTRKSTFTLLSLVLMTLLFVRFGFAAEPLVNINSAGAAELAANLSGIGPAKARAIVSYREQHGPFKTLDELIKVKGIGPHTLEKIRARLFVNTKHGLMHSQEAIVSTGVYSRPSQADIERETRRAIQSVLSMARRNSVTPKH